MAPLNDPRREAFAWACAGGASRSAAYVEAGYKANRGNAAKLAARPTVAARIAELERLRDPAQRACLRDTIVGLINMADAANLKSAGSLKEARVARVEANRLWGLLQREEAQSRRGRPTAS